MAIKPVITTGLALASAAAIIAATPAIMPAGKDVQVPATTVAAPLALKQLTVEEYRLLAVTIGEITTAYLQGYGGIVTGTKNGDCGAEDAVCQKGWVGVPYLLIDDALPADFDADNIFFEQGLVPFVQMAAVAVAAAVPDLTGQLDLVDRVNDFFNGGAVLVVGNILLDNLPDGSFAQDLTDAYFFGYTGNTGVESAGLVGAVTFIVDTVLNQVPPEEPEVPEEPEEPEETLLRSAGEDTLTVASEEGKEQTSVTPGPGIFKGPEFKGPVAKLLNLPVTPKVDAPVVEDTPEVLNTNADEETAKPELNKKTFNPLANLGEEFLNPTTPTGGLFGTGRGGGGFAKGDTNAQKFAKKIAKSLGVGDTSEDNGDNGDSGDSE